MFPICLPRLADKLFQAVLLERVKKARFSGENSFFACLTLRTPAYR